WPTPTAGAPPAEPALHPHRGSPPAAAEHRQSRATDAHDRGEALPLRQTCQASPLASEGVLAVQVLPGERALARLALFQTHVLQLDQGENRTGGALTNGTVRPTG